MGENLPMREGGAAMAALGLLGPAAWLQWRRGRWLRAARAIGRETSPSFLETIPALGAVISATGIALLWSWGVWLLFASVFVWVGVLGTAEGEGEFVRRRHRYDDQEHRST